MSHSRSFAVLETLNTIQEAFATLVQARDLSPNNPNINRVLSALVAQVQKPHTLNDVEAILAHPSYACRREHLWALLGQAEGAMEQFWANHLTMVEPAKNLEDLKKFIYYNNYAELVELEAASLHQAHTCDHNKPVVFVGAGPLPLTAILLHDACKCPVVCLDKDPEAVRVARTLLKGLGLDHVIRYEEADGVAYDYKEAQAVLVASLVGNKDDVVRRIAATTADTAVIGVRTAEGLSQILYPAYEPDADNRARLRLLSKTAVHPRVINTTLFYRLG